MTKGKAPMIILTGPVHSGKSSLLAALVGLLRREPLKVYGIIAEGLWENGMRSGFDLIDLADGSKTPLSRRVSDNEMNNGIPYVFHDTGVAAGIKALSPERCIGADFVFVDELGILERRGFGWAEYLDPLLELEGLRHIWVVRSSCLKAIRARWDLSRAEIIMAEEPDALQRLLQACLGKTKCIK
jgi:nucleoside-triphosphatase THEP1